MTNEKDDLSLLNYISKLVIANSKLFRTQEYLRGLVPAPESTTMIQTYSEPTESTSMNKNTKEYYGRMDRNVLKLLDKLNWEFSEGLISKVSLGGVGFELDNYSSDFAQIKDEENKFSIYRTLVGYGLSRNNSNKVNYRSGHAYVLSPSRIQEADLDQPLVDLDDAYALVFPQVETEASNAVIVITFGDNSYSLINPL
ncbi:MAG: hypothetical protein GOU98_00515 [Candidatus Altiarchaeota archaeon]|nr:hypothetical protein [Candidatus Altiarchaeota archaeon]